MVVLQNVTINTGIDEKGKETLPRLGKGLFMGAGAKIIGNKKVGDRVSISVDAIVYNKEIPDDSVVLNMEEENSLVKRRKKNYAWHKNFLKYILLDV